MSGLELFNNIITVISFLANIVLILHYIKKAYIYYTDKRYLKKVLGFDDKTVLVTHSTFKFLTGQENVSSYITYDSLRAINKVIDMLNSQKIKFDLIGNKDSQNEVNIGGMLTNKRVGNYFRNHFKNFKYVASKDREEIHRTYSIEQSIVEYSTGSTTGFKINGEMLPIDNSTDYAFIIKLLPDDFQDEMKKTVHIIFGSKNIGTVKAAEYLATHYKQIYRKYKDKHYFFAIKVNCNNSSINYAEGIKDFTNEMFIRKEK